MTNGICQPNQTVWEEEQNSCRPEPIDCNPDDPYLEPTVVDAEVIGESTGPESSAESTVLPPENGTSGDSYHDAPTETLQSIAPKSNRPPYAVRIHQTSERAGKETILTAHVGIEDYRAMESRRAYDAVVVQRGRGPEARVVSARIVNHETGEAVAMSRKEVKALQRGRQVSADELLVSNGEVPTPVMVVRAMIRGPEEVRRLATPETEVEQASSPLVAAACALCGEHFDEPEVPGSVDPASANPEDNPNEQAVTVADLSTPATDVANASAPGVTPQTGPSAEPVVVAAVPSQQNGPGQTPVLEQEQPPVRPNPTMARSASPRTVSIPDGYEGNGSGDSGPSYFGSVAVRGGLEYFVAGAAAPIGLVVNQSAVRRGSSGNSTSVATTPVTRDSRGRPIASTRTLPIHESYGPSVETDGAGVVTHLFPRVGVPVTIGPSHADATGVIPEFPRPGSLDAALSVVRSLRTAGDQPVVTRRPTSDGRDADPTSPDLMAGLAYNRAGAEAARVVDPSDVSFVSPQAAFLAQQGSGIAGRSVHVDSREMGDAIDRADARLHTVSDRTDTGAQTGGQDSRRGSSDPQAVAMDEVGDDLREGELVDDDFEPYVPLGYADIVDVIA